MGLFRKKKKNNDCIIIDGPDELLYAVADAAIELPIPEFTQLMAAFISDYAECNGYPMRDIGKKVLTEVEGNAKRAEREKAG